MPAASINEIQSSLDPTASRASATQLYIIRHDNLDVGIGTTAEIDALIAEGVLPADVDLVRAG